MTARQVAEEAVADLRAMNVRQALSQFFLVLFDSRNDL